MKCPYGGPGPEKHQPEANLAALKLPSHFTLLPLTSSIPHRFLAPVHMLLRPVQVRQPSVLLRVPLKMEPAHLDAPPPTAGSTPHKVA